MMRVTIHMVSGRDYWPLTEAVREDRRELWLMAARRVDSLPQLRAAAGRVRSVLTDGPRTRAEIVERIGLDSLGWNGVGLLVDLVRVPPSGTWEQRRADLYGLAEDWLGPSDATAEEGLALLVKRYLAAFGPASRKDLASWSGLRPQTLAPMLERLRLRRFRDEAGGELLDVPGGALPDPETPAPPRFLPTWDAVLLTHARRTRILPERFRARVFHPKTPHSVPTFLVDGRVAGSWRGERGRVRLEPFERFPREARRELDEEKERLEVFLS
jgi:hypothetical protein